MFNLSHFKCAPPACLRRSASDGQTQLRTRTTRTEVICLTTVLTLFCAAFNELPDYVLRPAQDDLQRTESPFFFAEWSSSLKHKDGIISHQYTAAKNSSPEDQQSTAVTAKSTSISAPIKSSVASQKPQPTEPRRSQAGQIDE